MLQLNTPITPDVATHLKIVAFTIEVPRNKKPNADYQAGLIKIHLAAGRYVNGEWSEIDINVLSDANGSVSKPMTAFHQIDDAADGQGNNPFNDLMSQPVQAGESLYDAVSRILQEKLATLVNGTVT